MHQLHPTFDPYNSSDEENTLLSQIDDAHSVNSQSLQSTTPSYISEQRQTFCCPGPTYTKSRKALDTLLKSKNDLEFLENELEHERRRGRLLLVACILMSILCGILFIDRWPEDWRGVIIEYLENGRDDSDSSSSSVKDSDDPLKAFRSQDSGAAGDDDDHYSKYGSSYETYKETHGKNKVGKTSSVSTSENDDASGSTAHMTEEQLNEEIEAQHIDSLSKYLKWNLPYKEDRDVPIHWHIPMTGTLLADKIFGHCYKLIQAADDVGLLLGHENDKILNVVTSEDGTKYVNVDMGSISGIKRANDLHLARSGTVNLIRTSYLYEAALLFENNAKYGKCFTILRDPIQRAIDVFYQLKQSSNVVFQNMKFEEYVKSSYCEENWMVRFLSDEMEGELEQHHLDLSKHVLGRKCLVGLAEQFEESIKRFSHYFNWDKNISKDDLQKCEAELGVQNNLKNREFKSIVTPGIEVIQISKGDELYSLLEEKNEYDIELYQYAMGLFNRQSLYGRPL